MLDLNVYLKELEEIVSIESPTDYPAGTKAMAEYLNEKLTALGWLTEFIDCGSTVGPCLKAVNRATDKYDLLMLGHMDTVFPLGTLKECPFSVDGNIVRGPGVNDMKGGLLYMYHAAKYLTEQKLLDDTSICLLFNPDEETGTKASRGVVEAEAIKADLIFVLEGARPNGAMVKERKGVGAYTLTFKGIAAHAGVAPQNGASALIELFNWGLELNKLTDFDKGLTVNIGVASGGSGANVVAEHASAKVDLRVLDAADAALVDAKLQELLQNPFNHKVKTTVQGGLNRPPMNTSSKSLEACAQVTAIAKTMGIDLEWISTGGGSDGNFTAALGVPTLDGMGPIGGDLHSIKEYALLDSYVPRFNLLIESIKQIVIK